MKLIIYLVIGVAVGYLLATGDLSCRMHPNALQHLWDTVQGVHYEDAHMEIE